MLRGQFLIPIRCFILVCVRTYIYIYIKWDRRNNYFVFQGNHFNCIYIYIFIYLYNVITSALRSQFTVLCVSTLIIPAQYRLETQGAWYQVEVTIAWCIKPYSVAWQSYYARYFAWLAQLSPARSSERSIAFLTRGIRTPTVYCWFISAFVARAVLRLTDVVYI